MKMYLLESLYDYLKEKGTNPETKDKICIEVAPRKENDYKEFTYGYMDGDEEVVFSYNQVGKVTYEEMLKLTDLFLRHQKFFHENGLYGKVNYTPLTICKKVFLDYIAIFIANLKLKKIPVLFPMELNEDDFDEYLKYNHFFEHDSADFYVFSSGSTGVLNKPKPVYEKDLIKYVVNDFIIKNNIQNEKFYSTMSMNGIAGVTFNAFFPIITNNQIYINDNTDFFENIYYTKSTMFILPLNYMDFLPIKYPECNDFSHVKYILISGGYFNNNDIDNLLNNLPGLKRDAIIYLYSSTEFEGNSLSAPYNKLDPISLSMPSLLKNEVKFSSGLDSISYLSSGNVRNSNCQIIDENNLSLPEDKLGRISFNGIKTDDIGIIHHDNLYVIGRKADNDTYNLSIISNYFRYHLNNDAVAGIYNGQLIIYTDIINNYYSPYVHNLDTRRGVYQSYKDNFLMRDKANELIKYLEDNYDIEFYGDAILHKFLRNDRLEKVRFDYKKYDPFDYNFKNVNGANLFDTYYFISSHFENLFLIEIYKMLYNVSEEEFKNLDDPCDVFKLLPLNRIYSVFKRINDNEELIEKINNTPVLSEIVREVLFTSSFLSLDFLDMHHFDINHSNMTAKEIMKIFELEPKLNSQERIMARDLVCIIRDLQNKFDIKINDRQYYQEDYYYKRLGLVNNSSGNLITLLEEISYDDFDIVITGEEKKKSYHWFWRS